MPDLFVADKNSEKGASKTPLKNEASDPPREEATAPKAQSSSSHSRMGLFTTFCMNPTGVTFEHQEQGETVLLFLRRHIVTTIRWVVLTIILLFLPLFLPLFAALLQTDFSLSAYWIIGLGFYYLAVIGYAFLQLITWFYNVGIVTNFRVVDIDLHGITNRNVATTSIHDVVEVEYTQAGFLQSFFNYGNVHMQTEGLKPNFEYLSVPKPAKVSDVISDLIRQAV